ncbi:hypothetical protein Bca4012_012128 [Brassica carinata]
MLTVSLVKLKNSARVSTLLAATRQYHMMHLIPANVVREHGLTFGDSIKYIDAEGVLMKVERGKCADDRVCFKGWNRICRRNRLREQDTSHCEMLHVRKKVHSIKITITRG